MSLAAAPPAPPVLDEAGADGSATGTGVAAGVAAGSAASGAAALFAVDPAGLGGIVARGHAGPVRDRWLAALRGLMPPERPWRRIPCHVAEDRLLGGLDLAATLSAGRPVASRGLLAECDGGVAVLAMAERLEARAVAAVAAAVDRGEVMLERDGIADRHAARLGVVALDESVEDEARPPSSLTDRLAFHVDLRPVALGDLPDPVLDAADVAAARERLAGVVAGEEAVEALIATAMALGIASLRAPLLALRAARAAAALAGRDHVEEEDAALAARLVLAPRATRLPPAESEEPEAEAEPDTAEDDPPPADDDPGDDPGEPPEKSPKDEDDRETDNPDRPLEDVVLEAVQAALPPDLLARLAHEDAARGPGGGGRAGSKRTGPRRGRPIGARRGEPRGGARLDVIETLKAAAPWQRLRRPDGPATVPDGRRRLEVRRDDFRVKRLEDRAESVTVFAVDASGSAALERLAEAKGAVERLLADSYARRDRVALVAFRGAGAEILLPPTRSLTRARRSLSGLPGGGGTPLAAGLDVAMAVVEAERRQGRTATLVVLTDGKANVARDGTGGRQRAGADAEAAARRVRAAGVTALVVDTSARPREAARALAQAIGAAYLPLPRADGAGLSAAVRRAAPAGRHRP